jgi:transcriptional regulator with XRE-family HTH domain
VSKANLENMDRAIGALVRARRYKVEMGQPELAKALDVTPMMIQKYETGASSLKAKTLVAIARALKCSTMDLFPKGCR